MTALSLSRIHDHIQTYHARWDSSGRVIGPLHSQETDLHAPGKIRTRNSSKRAAADPHQSPAATGIDECVRLSLIYVTRAIK